MEKIPYIFPVPLILGLYLSMRKTFVLSVFVRSVESKKCPTDEESVEYTLRTTLSKLERQTKPGSATAPRPGRLRMASHAQSAPEAKSQNPLFFEIGLGRHHFLLARRDFNGIVWSAQMVVSRSVGHFF